MWRNLLDGPHLIVIIVLVVLIFGWKKLPDAARSLGRSARILKSELGDDDHKSSASSQTVPGQTQPPAGSAPGEAPIPGATPYPQQGQQAPQQQAPQGYQQPADPGYQQQPQQGQPQQQQAPAGYPQQGNTGGNGN